MTMSEGAATRVLARDTNRITRLDEGCKGQMLAHAPIKVLVAARHGTTIVE